MNISSFWSWQAPTELTDILVVVDIYMMTTNLSILLAKKPRRLLLVNEENYQKAQEIYKNTVLIGESPLFPLSKFAFTFPSEMAKVDISGKNLLYMTLNGSRVFEHFWKEGRLLLGAAFNNLKSVVDFLKNKDKIVLIKSGDTGREIIDDQLAAEVIMAELQGKRYDWQEKKQEIRAFFRNYYGHPQEREESIKYIFARDVYSVLPTCRKNKEGFLEIFDKIKKL